MSQIFKYPLTEPIQVVQMPAGSQVLCVQVQGLHPTLWALVADNKTKEARKFEVIGTGNHFDYQGKTYIGTVQKSGLVWHIFENVGEL